ncbi:MAG TPA: gamma-glutamyltransferase [Bryobacteraceae bacterium]
MRYRGLVAFLCPAAVCLAAMPVTAKHGMVSAQEPIAAKVGLSVLKSGGNAIDAAIATGFALAVTHPYAGNLGGGGFMLVRLANGKTAFLDFRECAPAKATRNMYIGPDGNPTKESIDGWRSSGVPGSVAGFAAAYKRFGSKPWEQLLAPAIKLARNGFTVTPEFAESLSSDRKRLAQYPESKKIFLRDGDLYKPGDIFKQPELAATLERIAKYGAQDFYHGEIAHQFAAAMAAHGGLITLTDLAHYKVYDRKPLTGDYHGFHIITAPPPSAGGVGILQMMYMLEGTHYASGEPDSVKAVHYEAEAMRRFYADRSAYLGDPAYYKIPVHALLSPKYIARRRSTIKPDRATPSSQVAPGLKQKPIRKTGWKESNETTHYNVVDAKGDAVAVTYTLNNGYGNAITVPGLGFLLNDEMDDFAAKPGAPNMYGLTGSAVNAIAPGKRPLSSMSPTIITKNGKFFMAVGAPGGARITTGVMEVILHVLDFHMNVEDAVNLPRFHEQWKPATLYLAHGFPQNVAKALQKMGYHTQPTDGVARVIAIVSKNGLLEGGTESSRPNNVAVGY